jgi:hypothetical protein
LEFIPDFRLWPVSANPGEKRRPGADLTKSYQVEARVRRALDTLPDRHNIVATKTDEFRTRTQALKRSRRELAEMLGLSLAGLDKQLYGVCKVSRQTELLLRWNERYARHVAPEDRRRASQLEPTAEEAGKAYQRSISESLREHLARPRVVETAPEDPRRAKLDPSAQLRAMLGREAAAATDIPVGMSEPGSHAAEIIPDGMSEPAPQSTEPMPVRVNEPGSPPPEIMPSRVNEPAPQPAKPIPVRRRLAIADVAGNPTLALRPKPAEDANTRRLTGRKTPLRPARRKRPGAGDPPA